MIQVNRLVYAFNILKKGFPDYEDRPQQIEMAEEVYACLENKGRLLIEAGTGVGKSFAYLIPAILSKRKTIVSTATIALQNQLVNKDLAFLRKRLPQDFSYAILKGKNNYLCPKREREFAELGEEYKGFREWAWRTRTGDRDELPSVPHFWNQVCGDSDDCNGKDCPFFKDCFYYKHFRELHKVDILVVNHHLLVYDLITGLTLLPFHEQLIIDEAHRIEDVISHVFGTTLSSSRVRWLLYRLRGLKIEVDHLLKDVDGFFKRMELPSRPVHPIPEVIIEGLRRLKGLLDLDRVAARLKTWMERASNEELRDRMETTIGYVLSLRKDIDDFIKQEDSERVYYMAGGKGGIELKSSLVESMKPFNELIMAYKGMVMTSATLTAGRDFGFIKGRLGIKAPLPGSRTGFKEKVIDSPFDYKRQAVLYIDSKIPPPYKENSKTFRHGSLKVIEGLVNASRGRAFVLFTSYSHLHFVSENIRIDYPFKSQGDMPPPRLIDWFRDTPNSVLLATTTFWQGIDIKGEDLSLVVIVKIPFGSPGDPVYDERCRRLGERWFAELALPSAIMLLRQGFGRLIRGRDDYGVVAILDARLIKSSYGRTIISSLPAVEHVHSIKDVESFFKSLSPF